MAETAARGSLEAAVRADGDLKLIPYLMGGFPDRRRTVEFGRRLASSGAAALELGIPFSDPLADGPVIQRAGQAALAAGAGTGACIEMAAEIARDGGAPIVFMTYLNPILAYGARRFAADAAAAGVAGVIIPDLPVEEAEPMAGWLRATGLDTIFFATPTSSDARLARAGQVSSGFLYCVTLTGITGMRAELPADLGVLIARVREATSLPVAAGFGISRPEHLAALVGVADAAIVGTAVVAEVAAGRDPSTLVGELLQACR